MFRCWGGCRAGVLPSKKENMEEAITTNDKCPNKCGQLLVTWTEADGPDDYRKVWYCNQCEERFDE